MLVPRQSLLNISCFLIQSFLHYHVDNKKGNFPDAISVIIDETNYIFFIL